MTAETATYEFKTETRQLLDLMVHSVYSHREIFLRELISNASDALDRLRFEALTDERLRELAGDLHIRLEPDEAARTLTVHDNGVGMTRDELQRFIGTIARSGTRDHAAALREAPREGYSPELIGQFGVGFYSSFMVADRVTVLTRRAGEDLAWLWESKGDGTYTVSPAQRPSQGTSVTLYLKDAPPTEEGDEPAQDFTSEWTLRGIVKKYSDFVSYPIRLRVERSETERDEEGKIVEGAQPRLVQHDEVLNSMKAIWLRPESEVTPEEYKEFYRHLSHDWKEPLRWFTYRAEGASSEFKALLYLPTTASRELFRPDAERGLSLYVHRVFIMHDCKELIPEYLRFVEGVVDSEDLSLNISREILQQDRQIKTIRRAVARKVLSTLESLRDEEPETYRSFWKEFGRFLKEGIYREPVDQDRLLELCNFRSTRAGEEGTSLAGYLERADAAQDSIYYMAGPSLPTLEASPHLEAFRARDVEVLLLTDPVDEVWTQFVHEYKGKKLVSVGKGKVDLGTPDEQKARKDELGEQEANLRPLLDLLQEKLAEQTKEVRLSTRLTSSPACLVGEEYDLSPQLAEMLEASGQKVERPKRILEVNGGHPLLVKLQQVFSADPADPRLADMAELLYGQALLAEGGSLLDPVRFGQKLTDLMLRGL